MKKLFLLMLTVFAFCAANAQVTTSGMNGTVTDQNGAPLAGATVIAVHTPSGTQYGAVTNKDGRYNLQGMRTGGPYTVTFSFVGYQTVEFTGISLQLGEYLTRDAKLKDSQELEAVVVSGVANQFNSNKTGAAQNFNSAVIATVPTISRSIYDVAKLTPQASSPKGGGVSLGGGSNRYNSFQIDGIVSNDVFGLTSTGTNGGQTGANPISLDAIEEIQVVVAPFDVRQSGFTGGGINAVTKSGTNQFKGSAYTYYNNEGFYGTTPGKDVKKRESLSEQSTQIYGATIGGPIIKDKLFFFVSGEYSKETYPSSYYVGYSGAHVSKDLAEQLANKYKEYTGMDAGGYGQRDIDTKSGSVLARVDWNINANNNLSVRYNFLDASKDKFANYSNTFNFGSAGYKQVNRTHSLVAELNSRLSENISNELRFGWTMVRDYRDPGVAGAPLAIIKNAGDDNNTTINIGTEAYSGANRLNQDIYTFTDNMTFYSGTHAITVGTHNEIYNMYNLFMRNSTGTWTFNSVDDFMNDMASQYAYNYSDEKLTGTPVWGPSFKAGQFGLYVQDEWRASKNFTLTYGLRIDLPVFFTQPTTNVEFNRSEFAQKNDVRTGETPNTKVLWSPRLGFRWYLDESHNTLLRGGVGIFTGRVPFVWISNSFTNTGVEMLSSTIYGSSTATAYGFGKAPNIEGKKSNPEVNVTSKDFKYPQVFRANLALEHNFGAGWRGSFEALISKTFNNIYYQNLVAEDNGKKVYAVNEANSNAANTTTYYDSPGYTDYYGIYSLTNSNKGYSYSLSVSMQKHFDFGLDLMAFYTYGRTKAINDGMSSQAASNWGKNFALRTNSPELAWSFFDIPHRVTAQVSYTKRYARFFGSTISLIYQGYSGQRYSLAYNDNTDFNGDTYRGNSLMYIPTTAELEAMKFTDIMDEKDKTKVKVDVATQKKNMEAWIEGDKDLRDTRGKFTKRNQFQSPFEHHLDLHFAQDFYFGAMSGRKLQVTLDIINFGNMLCRSWGASYTDAWNLSPVTVAKIDKDANGNATPTYQYKGQENIPSDIFSRWHMQLGVRVVF